MENKNITRIQTISRRLQFVIIFFIAVLLIDLLSFWIFFNQLPKEFVAKILTIEVAENLPPVMLFYGFLMTALPAAIAIYGLINLKKLFGFYEQMVIFSIETVSCFSKLGYALMVWVVVKVAYTPLLAAVLSPYIAAESEEKFMLTVRFSDVGFFMVGLIVLLISWVMEEALALQKEQEYTV